MSGNEAPGVLIVANAADPHAVAVAAALSAIGCPALRASVADVGAGRFAVTPGEGVSILGTTIQSDWTV